MCQLSHNRLQALKKVEKKKNDRVVFVVTYHPAFHACPKLGLIHRDRVMPLMKQGPYLQATTAGFLSQNYILQSLLYNHYF